MTFEKIRSIIADQFEEMEDSISLDTNIVDDLGADSLDAAELIVSIEEEFDLSVSDEDAAKLTTVAKIVEYIDERC